jgi:glycosyltransferase involved in cell wall biosynthesis
MIEASDGAGGNALILYDLTLLAGFCHTPTATGIPAVDLNFALHVRKRYAAECVFVVWGVGEFWVVPDETANLLLSALSARWFGAGPPVDESEVAAALRAAGFPDGKADVPGSRAKKRKHKKKRKQARGETRGGRQRASNQTMASRAEAAAPRPAALTAGIKRSSRKNPIYINVYQFELRNRRLFVRLQDNLGALSIVYIHDLIPVEFPEYTGRPSSAKLHKNRLLNSSNHASLVLCNSEYVRTSLVDYFNDNHLPVPEIKVCPIGSDHLTDEPVPVGDMPETYFMMIGTIEGRKNHISMLHLWRDLVLRGHQPPKLFIVGKRGWASEAALTMLDRSEVLRGHVVELNNLETGKMLGMLAGARALLFPSFTEGWGMPLIEALRLGVPAICSDIPALREAGQGIPDYVSPIDLKEWERLVLDYAKPESDLRREQLRRLTGFTPPVWADAFRVLDRTIDDLVRQQPLQTPGPAQPKAFSRMPPGERL